MANIKKTYYRATLLQRPPFFLTSKLYILTREDLRDLRVWGAVFLLFEFIRTFERISFGLPL